MGPSGNRDLDLRRDWQIDAINATYLGQGPVGTAIVRFFPTSSCILLTLSRAPRHDHLASTAT